jgi:Domain of unknown function (DUF4258)
MTDPAREPLKPPDAKKLAREIVNNGTFDFSGHAYEEMANDGLQSTDCLNIIRAGNYDEPEYRNEEWRYRVCTQRMCVVIAFMSETRLRVITAWRNDQ